jgi:LemA protein
MKKITYAIIIIVVLAALYAWASYNKLVTLNETADTQWAQVETQYQRRFDLIPNLVESVKGVMTQEKEIFTALAEARSQYAGASTPESQAVAANRVDSALGRLLAVVENYPVLKSSETVQTLMAQLEGTENRIAVARKDYNDTLRTYNLSVKRFPSSVMTAIFGFDERPYFESAEGAATAPQVNLQ